jgi:hypothetical protein
MQQEIIDDLRHTCAAILAILLKKGIMTEKEFSDTKAQVISLSDQMKADLMDKWKKENPEEAKALEVMEKLFNKDFEGFWGDVFGVKDDDK